MSTKNSPTLFGLSELIAIRDDWRNRAILYRSDDKRSFDVRNRVASAERLDRFADELGAIIDSDPDLDRTIRTISLKPETEPAPRRRKVNKKKENLPNADPRTPDPVG